MPAFWSVRGRTVSLDRPLVMGIVNVTPDSFSDGGDSCSPDDAIARASMLIAEGADIIDIGGESTRPHGAHVVAADEELRRVLPVIQALSASHPDVLLSVDSVKSVVASAAIEAGAHIVNDVSAMRLDTDMADVCARHRVGVVLMHSRGGVEDMATYDHAIYAGDPMIDVLAELGERTSAVRSRGIARECIALDPGIGFSKRIGHSLRVLGCLERLVEQGFPVLVGASRKRFIGEITHETTPRDRVMGSVGVAVASLGRGAHIFRVHDVRATRQALDVAVAIRDAGCA